MASLEDLVTSWMDMFRSSYNLGYHPAILIGDTMNLDGQRASLQTPLDYLSQTAPQSITTINVAPNSVATGNIQPNAVTDQKISSLSADKITAGTIGADVIYAGTVSANQITAGTLQAGVIYAGAINANQITAGTLTVGGAGATAILINHTGQLNAILKWVGGSALWEDNSNLLGIWGHGGSVIIYAGSVAKATLTEGVPISFDDGKGVDITHGGGLFVDGSIHVVQEVRFEGDTVKFDYNTGHEVDFSVRNQGLTSYASGSNPHLVWGGGDDLGVVHGSHDTIIVNGSNKTAVVPVDDKYKALYTTESPEVWFTDFAMVQKRPWWKFWQKDGYIIDKDFLKVTSPPYIFLPTLNKTIVLVYAKRKGYENTRFEEKTKEQFDKNNEFWSTPDVV